MADKIYIYVLVIVAYNLTQKNLGVAVPMLSFGIPSVLFASFAGVYVDRWDRKLTMVMSSIIRAILILIIILFLQKSMVWIFAISFLVYTFAQFFAPAESSSLAEVVEKDNLIVANSLFMTTWMWTSVVGFALGAPLVNFFGEQITFVIAAFLYFASAIAVSMVNIKSTIGQKNDYMKSVKDDLLTGLEFLNRSMIIKYSIVKMMIVTSALAVISMLAIDFAEKYIGIGAKNFGILVIFVGVGMVFGMWALGRLSHHFKKSTIVFSGFVISGLTLMFLAYTKSLPFALFYLFLLGFSNILINATIQTILQQNTPKSLRGRIFGIQNMLINFAFTIPVVIFGGIADYFGLEIAIVVLGMMILVSGLVSFLIPKYRTV